MRAITRARRWTWRGSEIAARGARLRRIAEDLEAVCHGAPASFSQALQLFWLYALLAGVINYGRLDDVLALTWPGIWPRAG